MPEVPKIDIRPDHWEIVRGILQKHVPQNEVWAFGSRAKWTAKEYSDLDLAIISDKPLSLEVSARLSDDFSESDLPYKVDVVDWATTSESFRKIIERDRVVVQTVGRGWGMSADWPMVRVEDVCSLIVDCVNKTAPVSLEKTPFRMIRTTNVRNGRIDLCDCRFVNAEIFKRWTRRAGLEEGDVILTREAPIGEVGRVPKQEGLFLGQRLMQYRADPGKLDQRFLLYSFLSPQLQHQFGSHEGSGSVVSHIRVGDCFKFEMRLPPLAVQRKIGEVLGALDAKIDLNRRINQTLEAMAQAIFKSWFVDFDPVKAKIAAKQEGLDPLRAAMSAISGKMESELDALPPEQYDQLAATAALFPDEMEESELGAIPKEWAFQAADSLSEVGIGKTPPRKEPQWFTEGEGDWRWVSIKDMGTSGVFQQQSSEFLTSEAVSRFNVRVVPDRTVLLSFKLTIGRVAITDGPLVTNEAIAHFKLPSDAAISSEYLYLYLKGFDYSTLGSTSSIADAVNSKTLREMPVTVANRDLIDRFTKSVTPLFEEMRNRQSEIASLGATRDALLPKLLSGELSVNDAMAKAQA